MFRGPPKALENVVKNICRLTGPSHVDPRAIEGRRTGETLWIFHRGFFLTAKRRHVSILRSYAPVTLSDPSWKPIVITSLLFSSLLATCIGLCSSLQPGRPRTQARPASATPSGCSVGFESRTGPPNKEINFCHNR